MFCDIQNGHYKAHRPSRSQCILNHIINKNGIGLYLISSFIAAIVQFRGFDIWHFIPVVLVTSFILRFHTIILKPEEMKTVCLCSSSGRLDMMTKTSVKCKISLCSIMHYKVLMKISFL